MRAAAAAAAPFALMSTLPLSQVAFCWFRLVLGGGLIITEELADEDWGEEDLNGDVADDEDEDENELPLIPEGVRGRDVNNIKSKYALYPWVV